MQGPCIELLNVSHRYGRRLALDDVTLTIAAGEVVSVVGPSGSGKSTLLRIISGLELVQAGTVRIGGDTVATPQRSLPPERRHIGMMFQDFALFPHLTVAANIGFGLKDRPPEARRRKVAELLRMIALPELADAYPHMLSGGQQQRVALARAMARAPDVLLLDEPFSALDEQLRRVVREEVVNLIRASGIATILVTHDPEEAMTVGDRVVVMAEGRVAQAGSPMAVYQQPATSFVAGLFGEVNRFKAQVVDGYVSTPIGRFACGQAPSGAVVEVGYRTEDIALTEPDGRSASVRGRVKQTSFSGQSTRICLEIGSPGGSPGPDGGPRDGERDGDRGADVEIHARLPGYIRLDRGATVGAVIDPEKVMVFSGPGRPG